MVGQYAGMGQALSLEAVRAALDIEGVERDEWSEMTSQLLCIHAALVELTKKD